MQVRRTAMSAIVLKHIPLSKDIAKSKKNTHIGDIGSMSERMDELYTDAAKIAVPKAVYAAVPVSGIDGDTVTLASTQFKSKIMRANLSGIECVFAYTATCGAELEEWSKQFTDPIDRFLSDSIKEIILHTAMDYLFGHISETYHLTKTARMSPGSHPDWPILEQARLLSLIGDVGHLIGVTVTPTSLLLPMKSVSGILYATDASEPNCK